jgi:hypothetical protein
MNRGTLPETLGEAGFVFTIPEHCTPASGVVSTAQEAAPWVAVVERLWDDPVVEAEHRRRALAEARRWLAVGRVKNRFCNGQLTTDNGDTAVRSLSPL